ncbi:MAG: hypothetical protein ACK5MI_08105 [Mangrovibacterium sp.]
MKTKFIALSILFITLINTGTTYGQPHEFSKNSIKIGFGCGVSMGNDTEGIGMVYSVGYQREIWKDRLRLNPNFSIGHYSSWQILDAPDQFFNAINLDTKLFYDLIKVKTFSLVVGCGTLINNSKGCKGPEVYDDEDYDTPLNAGYTNNFHFGGYLGAGFRINSPNKRTVINIMPFNLHFGNNYFAELHAKIELDFKF